MLFSFIYFLFSINCSIFNALSLFFSRRIAFWNTAFTSLLNIFFLLHCWIVSGFSEFDELSSSWETYNIENGLWRFIALLWNTYFIDWFLCVRRTIAPECYNTDFLLCVRWIIASESLITPTLLLRIIAVGLMTLCWEQTDCRTRQLTADDGLRFG